MPATQLYIWPSVIVAAQSLDRARKLALIDYLFFRRDGGFSESEEREALSYLKGELATEPEIKEVYWK